MSRTMTVSQPLNLRPLLVSHLDRTALGATPYAMRLAVADGLIVRTGEKGPRGAILYKLTPKGRRRAKR